MQIDQDLTKCLVITNYRTGSTDFCNDNGKKNRIMCLYEILYQNGRQLPLQEGINLLEHTKTFIAKVMPNQFDYDYDKLQMLIEHCDQIVYLYRKDFQAQCLSWIAWNQSDNHNYRRGANISFDIDCSQEQADAYTDILVKNNDALKQLYKQYPAPVYAYEDIQTDNPYNRTYNWKQKVNVPEYNTQEIFCE